MTDASDAIASTTSRLGSYTLMAWNEGVAVEPRRTVTDGRWLRPKLDFTLR